MIKKRHWERHVRETGANTHLTRIVAKVVHRRTGGGRRTDYLPGDNTWSSKEDEWVAIVADMCVNPPQTMRQRGRKGAGTYTTRREGAREVVQSESAVTQRTLEPRNLRT